MKITGIETICVAVPRRRLHQMSGIRQAQSESVIVKVKTDQGIEGLGEARVMKEWGGDHGTRYGESVPVTLEVIHRYLAPAVEQQDPFNVEALLDRMDKAVRGYPYAKAAVEMALFDIMGKALNRPVYQLLGGQYRRWVPITHSIGWLSPEASAEEARAVKADGVKTIKIKVGRDLATDLAVIKAVRDAIGDDMEITLDANQGFRHYRDAIRLLHAAEPYNIAFIEQPVEGKQAMARVTQSVNVPVMADESAWGPEDVLELHEREGADYISIYLGKAGGFLRAKQVAAVASATGMLCNVNGSAELGVGNAANLHFITSTPVVQLSCVIPITTIAGQEQTRVGGVCYTDDIITTPFKYENGCLQAPDAPGLGVTLDPAKLEKYRLQVN